MSKYTEIFGREKDDFDADDNDDDNDSDDGEAEAERRNQMKKLLSGEITQSDIFRKPLKRKINKINLSSQKLNNIYKLFGESQPKQVDVKDLSTKEIKEVIKKKVEFEKIDKSEYMNLPMPEIPDLGEIKKIDKPVHRKLPPIPKKSKNTENIKKDLGEIKKIDKTTRRKAPPIPKKLEELSSVDVSNIKFNAKQINELRSKLKDLELSSVTKKQMSSIKKEILDLTHPETLEMLDIAVFSLEKSTLINILSVLTSVGFGGMSLSILIDYIINALNSKQKKI